MSIFKYIFLILIFPQFAYAATCSELIAQCNAANQYYVERIALQTQNGWTVEVNPIQQDGGCTLVLPPSEPPDSRSRYIKAYQQGWCTSEPLKCALPEVKVGIKPNGDEECKCPAGTTSMSYLPDKAIGNCALRDGMQVCCVSDSCQDGYKRNSSLLSLENKDYCVADASVCGEGYKPNPYYNPDPASGSLACIEDISCPAGTEKIAAIETQPGLNFFGTMPNPRFPNKTGYCNDNYCCVGVNPKPLPTGEKYCAQGSAIGFTDGVDAFADDSTTGGCTCPQNAVHESQGQFQSATQAWSGASFLNKNASLSPLVCDYSKPPADGSSLDELGLPTESIWDDKFDACAKYKDPLIPTRTYDLCVSMDQSMRDWIDNNVSCGTKTGMECLSAKMNDVMKHCHVVDGAVTCDQKYSPPEGVELPEAVIAKSDSHGFPQHQIDDLFDTSGMFDDPNASTSSSTRPPVSNNPKDLKPPVPPKIQPPKSSTKGSSSLSSPKDKKFAEVWDSKLLTDQRAYYSKMIDDFMKLTDKIKLPNVGGQLPCYDFDITKYLMAGSEPKKVCFAEKPYVDILDMLSIIIGFLTYLLPVIIFIRN